MRLKQPLLSWHYRKVTASNIPKMSGTKSNLIYFLKMKRKKNTLFWGGQKKKKVFGAKSASETWHLKIMEENKRRWKYY